MLQNTLMKNRASPRFSDIAADNLQDKPSGRKRGRASKHSHDEPPSNKKQSLQQEKTALAVVKASGRKRMRNSTADACKPNAKKSATILPQTSQSNDDMEIRGGGKDAALPTWRFNYIDEQWQRPEL